MFSNMLRALRIALLTFTVSLFISFFFSASIAWWLSLGILLIVILTGIAFDIVGTAVTAATETPFHAMAADKVSGSKQAIYLVRRADQVANFCNDVVGDIAGTIGGALVAALTLALSHKYRTGLEEWLSPIGIALVAALTVGGKAFGKSFAIERANDIVFSVGKLLAVFPIDLNSKKTSKKKAKSNSRKVKRGR